LTRYGAIDISLVGDLPLFVDPFLLFHSKKKEYQVLHRELVRYIRFLYKKAGAARDRKGLLKAWYAFPEIRQNWLGFSLSGNRGNGLGLRFAGTLRANLQNVIEVAGRPAITRGTHLEKLCLIAEGVGRDKISDFTTNLIHGYLLEYTERFARRHLDPAITAPFTVSHVRFNYSTEAWERGSFLLPQLDDDYVLLTPADLLTRDETWINRRELIEDFESLPAAIEDRVLREQISNYFKRLLPEKPSAADRRTAAQQTIRQFPIAIDYFIRTKEEHGDQAQSLSRQEVTSAKRLFVDQASGLVWSLVRTPFYQLSGTTFDEAMERIVFLKDVIENKGGHRFFYDQGDPIRREVDLHVLFRLVWFATPSDVSSEVNDGRGPADFKISRGAADKTIVEFKLASNSQLKRNLANQTDVYRKASNAKRAIKVIVYFSEAESDRATRILRELEMRDEAGIILIDARSDNKPAGSKA
jgi:hypothetical protein